MIGDDRKFWDDDLIAHLANCESRQLRDFAACVSDHPESFFRSVNFRNIDLRGQDLRGLDLAGANFVGALMDESTLFDDALSKVFRFDDEEALLSALDVDALPLFDKGRLVTQVTEQFLGGVRLMGLYGPYGVGKSTILREIAQVLLWHRSRYFEVPSLIREELRRNQPFVVFFKSTSKSIASAILSQLVSRDRSSFQKRTLSRVISHDDFFRGFSLQANLFNDPYDVLKQATSLSSSQQHLFLSRLFLGIRDLRPRSHIVVMIDDFDAFDAPRQLAELVDLLDHVQFIVCGRSLDRLLLALDLEKRATVSALTVAVSGLSVDGLKELFDALEAQARGALSFSATERGKMTLEVEVHSPEIIVNAVKLGVAYALSDGSPIPLQFKAEHFRKAASAVFEAFWPKNELTRWVETSPALATRIARIESILSRRGGLSKAEATFVLASPDGDVDRFLRALSRRGAISRNASGRWTGTLCGLFSRKRNSY